MSKRELSRLKAIDMVETFQVSGKRVRRSTQTQQIPKEATTNAASSRLNKRPNPNSTVERKIKSSRKGSTSPKSKKVNSPTVLQRRTRSIPKIINKYSSGRNLTRNGYKVNGTHNRTNKVNETSKHTENSKENGHESESSDESENTSESESDTNSNSDSEEDRSDSESNLNDSSPQISNSHSNGKHHKVDDIVKPNNRKRRNQWNIKVLKKKLSPEEKQNSIETGTETPDESNLSDKSNDDEFDNVINDESVNIIPKGFEKFSKLDESIINIAKNHVLSKLFHKKDTKVIGLDSQYDIIYQLLQHTIQDGEGNSCLVLGPSGSGKSLLVNTAINNLEEEYKHQFITLNLTGLAQTDDKMAIRELARQMDKAFSKAQNKNVSNETKEVEEYDYLEKKSISDTLTSFLQVLESNPLELGEVTKEENGDNEIENTKQKSMALIIILDDFEKFALHPRQTLLYNLFDIAMNSNAPVAVIGVTSRITAREMLEKRVKSRFSQRIIYVSRPNEIKDFWNVCKAGLTIDLEEKELDNLLPKHFSISQRLLAIDYANAWNDYLDQLFNLKAPSFYNLLNRIYYSTKDVALFHSKCIMAVANASPFPDQSYFSSLQKEQSNPETQMLVESLTDLQLALLISGARIQAKLESVLINFNLAYEEYRAQARKVDEQKKAESSAFSYSSGGLAPRFKTWPKGIAKEAWEALENLNLIHGTEKTASTKRNNRSFSRFVSDELRMMNIEIDLVDLNKIVRSGMLASWTKL